MDEDVCLYGCGVGYVVVEVNLISTRDAAHFARLLGV